MKLFKILQVAFLSILSSSVFTLENNANNNKPILEPINVTVLPMDILVLPPLDITIEPIPETNWDIDGNGQAKPLTDGLLALRYLFGFKDNTLISNAVGNGATRSTAIEIQAYLLSGVESEELDIDGDGEVKPLTDGLLLLRYLFGFKGSTLINNALGKNATRTTAIEIEAFLLTRMP